VKIPAECRIPGFNNAQSDVLQPFRNWLDLQAQCGWLMTVETVDDRNMFFATDIHSGKALRECILQSTRSSRRRTADFFLGTEDPVTLMARED